MRNTLFLMGTVVFMVVLCWTIKYGGVENITVRVADKATGNPIDDHFVFYHQRPKSSVSRGSEVTRATRQSAHSISREDLEDFDVWFVALGYRPQLLSPSGLSWSSWLRFGETVVALEPGPTLKGVVRDGNGMPVPEAVILTEMRNLQQDAPMPERIARTAADGTFESPDVRPFIEDMKAFKEGVGAGHCPVSTAMEISIQGSGITCRVLEAGKPIQGLWVIAEAHANTDQNSSLWWHAAQRTNAHGDVSFTAFPPGRTELTAQQYVEKGQWKDCVDFAPARETGGPAYGSKTVNMQTWRGFRKWLDVASDKTADCAMDAPGTCADLQGLVSLSGVPVPNGDWQGVRYTVVSPAGDVCLTTSSEIRNGRFSLSPIPCGDALVEANCYSPSEQDFWRKTLWISGNHAKEASLGMELQVLDSQIRAEFADCIDEKYLGVRILPAEVPLDRVACIVENGPSMGAYDMEKGEHSLSCPCAEGKYHIVLYEGLSQHKVLDIKTVDVGKNAEVAVPFDCGK